MIEELFKVAPYALAAEEKDKILLKGLNQLTQHHLENCAAYSFLFRNLKLPTPPYSAKELAPWLPVSLFKEHELLSIQRSQIYKILLSSGTTGTLPSKIFLDSLTSRLQTQALANIMTHFLGTQRLPLLIIDTEKVIKNPKEFSARGAAILGMLTFGRDPLYFLDANIQEIEKWLRRHSHESIFIFGFTFMVWEHLFASSLEIPNGILFHSGGWKKLQDREVSPEIFKKKALDAVGITRSHNFYGMVEQVGSIFVECEKGRLHTPAFADVIFRDSKTWKPSNEGVIEVLSLLPHSYPGHILLTEDLGRSFGVDNCPCGRKGETFLVSGRVPQVEPRGCSDVG